MRPGQRLTGFLTKAQGICAFLIEKAGPREENVHGSKVKTTLFKGGLEAVEKASQSSRPQARMKWKSVFSGGVYVGENTFRPASVGTVRYMRTVPARSRAVSPSKKWLCHFFDTLKTTLFRSGLDFFDSPDIVCPLALSLTQMKRSTLHFNLCGELSPHRPQSGFVPDFIVSTQACPPAAKPLDKNRYLPVFKCADYIPGQCKNTQNLRRPAVPPARP